MGNDTEFRYERAKTAAKRLSQDEWEFENLCQHARRAHSILEIGSRYGASIDRLARAAPALTWEKRRIVAVDLGVDPFSPVDEDILTPLTQTITDLCQCGYDARLVLGNSQSAKVIEIVRELGPFDLVFIDGDHSYNGVYSDWTNYGPMGKVVAFHDINYGKPGFDGAKTLWAQLRAGYCHAEYVRSGLGIGLVFRTEEMR